MSKRTRALAITALICFVILSLVYISMRRSNSSRSSVQNEERNEAITPPGVATNRGGRSRSKIREDQTQVELYVDEKKIKQIQLSDLKKLRLTQLPRTVRNHTVIKVADILKWAQVSEGSSIRFTSYDNYTVDFDFLEVINDEKKLVLISTNVPSWKMGDFDNAKTLEGRGSGNEGGFILRGVKRITVHSQTSAVSKVTKNGCDSKVYISIEDALSHSKSACNLSLAGKELSELPTDITKLTKLTILNLGHNSFSEFPQELLSLTDLEEINLSSNTLTTLPDMSTLSKLTSLKLGRNQFEQFPLSVLTLTNLRTLELDNNKLTSVPAEITQLSALEEFEFANNNISSLPPEVAALKTLKEVDLKGNPLSATEKRNIKSYFPRAKVEF